MYAVGKVGSLISRSVYTVSGPFHPFGGAVDIVVVQQQDGSFKSSPWYVRFGKFQGVLKTREKVVNISVNGVEAGFHMYLDSNGEAYFLRDADPNGEEGEFIVSPASSGDEQEVPTLRKSKSTSCDSSTMEADVEDNKILARTTTSRRITILERMFGRKSVKHDAHSVDRVSSLERAEIAAELLDTKWSTNLSRGSSSHSSNDQPSKSIVAVAANSDQMETSEIVLSEHSFDHGKEMESKCNNSDCDSSSPGGGRNSSANETDNCLQTTSVKEEIVEIYTHDISDLRITSTTDQAGSEYLSNDLGTDKTVHASVDTLGGSLDNFEDVIVREIHTKELLSDDIFEIHSVDTEITNVKSEVVSHFVTGDSDGANQNSADTNSPTYCTTDGSTERHEVLSMSSAQDVVNDKMVVISSTEAVENYAMTSIFADKVLDAADISLTDGVDMEEHFTASRVTVEQLSEEYRASINKEDKINAVVQEQADSVLEDVQANGPDMESSAGTILDYRSTNSSHDLACKHDLVCSDASSNVEEILTLKIVPEDITKDSSVEKEAYSREHSVSVTPASPTAEGSKECIVQFANFSNNEEMEDFPIITDEIEGPDTKNEDADRPISMCKDEIRFMQEETEETEAVVSFAEHVEEIQFHFSDTESFADTKVMDEMRANKKVDQGEYDESGSDAEEQKGGCTDFPIITDEIEAPDTKNYDADRPISMSKDEIRFMQEETEETEAVVSFAEHVEEIQFQFSDTESFADTKVMDEMRANKKVDEGEYGESDSDADEQKGGCTDFANDLENCSVKSIIESSPLPVPGCELHSGDTSIGAKSLPNLRSHIHDLERSDSVQLSRSLCSNPENNVVEPDKNMNSAEQELEASGDPEENSKAAEVTSNSPEDEHTSDLKVDSFNPVAELSLCRHLLSEGMGEDAARRAFDSEKVSLEKFRTMKQSLTRNNKLVVRIAGRYFPWDAAAPIVLGLISFSEEQAFEPQGMIKVERVETSLAPGGSWRIWPFNFRQTRAISTVEPVCESIVETSLPSPVKEADREKSKSRTKRMNRKVRSLTPTSEELASLDLREGRNVITFTFSTAMLGKQQVDCRIYLWKWNTRIVISDVDGTITKSDVLGQFMPLVGVDWSQNGVAHLFSAIKENGYQLLFLSARAISQAHLTRQFLFNLKQDGKALPDGPVVISPDGLFPSLYREVIRRAPHEFKISCLEAIRALFPPDSNPNPFYAGFGNRDTDELSYLKVGIPLGKIFIINPKGEVAVNRRVDTKSYTSLHALVNGMFPPISLSPEQEDYNSWNYWKMPLPDVDI